MPTIYWTDPAVIDLEGIFDFIAFDSPSRAEIFVQQLSDTTRRLQDFPLSGRVVPEFQKIQLREVVFKGYRIIYRVVNSDRIDILTVFSDFRDAENLIGDLQSD